MMKAEQKMAASCLPVFVLILVKLLAQLAPVEPNTESAGTAYLAAATVNYYISCVAFSFSFLFRSLFPLAYLQHRNYISYYMIVVIHMCIF